MALSEKQVNAILDKALAAAKKAAPGGDARVSLSPRKLGNTRFAASEITSSADVETVSLSVTVSFGLKHASASGNQLDDASIAAVATSAARLAKLAPEDAEWMPALGAQKYMRLPGATNAATAKLGPDTRAKAAEASLALVSKDLDVAGFYSHHDSITAHATSAGLRAFHRSTGVQLTCTARTTDGTGSGWAGASSHRVADVDASAVAKIAADKGARSMKPRKLDPGRYTVVLEPAAVEELLGFMTSAMGARAADEGRSFFSNKGGGNKVGEKLFPETITLKTDPGDLPLGAMPFDGEGMARQPTTWVDKGVLTSLRYDRYWAAKQGKTAHAQNAGWQMAGGSASMADLVKGVKKGVLITRFWYTRWVDPASILITGLTRDGNFLIENGEIVGPVNNFRFNESPVTMLTNADAFGTPVVSPNGGFRVPALRTHEFNLASISEAV